MPGVGHSPSFLPRKLRCWWHKHKLLSTKKKAVEEGGPVPAEQAPWVVNHQLLAFEGLFDEYLEMGRNRPHAWSSGLCSSGSSGKGPGDAAVVAAALNLSSSFSFQSCSLASSPFLWLPVPWHPSLPCSTTGWRSAWTPASSSVITGGPWLSGHRASASGSPSWRSSPTWLSAATYAGQRGGGASAEGLQTGNLGKKLFGLAR